MAIDIDVPPGVEPHTIPSGFSSRSLLYDRPLVLSHCSLIPPIESGDLLAVPRNLLEMNRFLSIVVRAFWAMLPAYVPNNAAVLADGSTPIDGGRTWRENRLLGDGKTWRGTVLGTACGLAFALVLNRLNRRVTNVLGISLPRFGRSALTLSLGAMVGDIVASFYKRQSGRERGAPVLGLDQLDFVLGALSLTALVSPTWFRRVFRLPVLVVVLLVTPLLHLGTNLVAYLLGLKDEPY